MGGINQFDFFGVLSVGEYRCRATITVYGNRIADTGPTIPCSINNWPDIANSEYIHPEF